MNKTPKSNREHISFYGKVNVGKSSLVNKVLGQELSIVSDIGGTTTDPVSKSMELLSYGPVVITDTAGLGDKTELGSARLKKTLESLDKTDLAVYVMDSLKDEYKEKMLEEFKKRDIPYILVLNKIDSLGKDLPKEKNLVRTSIYDEKTIDILRSKIIENLELHKEKDKILDGLLAYGSKIVLVIDIDSGSPKGRLILPQVQVLRDALDKGMISVVLKNTELKNYVEKNEDIDLVITDSKIFKEVEEILPKDMALTSFSILMARNKGDLKTFVKGARYLEKLKNREKVKILMAETCRHTASHEDVGQVKIPNMLRKKLSDVKIDFTHIYGDTFTLDEDYDLVVHCGSCMSNRKSMETRINKCREKDIEITNYGILISYCLGILDRAIGLFNIE